MKPEQLTAWALHEASPEERAQIEAQLAEDHALREQAEALKSFCTTLEQELAASEDGGLTAMQKAQLERSLQPAVKKPSVVLGNSTSGHKQGVLRVLAIAACLMLGLFLFIRGQFGTKQPSEAVAVVMGKEVMPSDKQDITAGGVLAGAPPLKKQVVTSSATMIQLPEDTPVPEIGNKTNKPITMADAPRSRALVKSGAGQIAVAPSRQSVSDIAERETRSRLEPGSEAKLEGATYSGVAVTTASPAAAFRPELDSLDRASVSEADGSINLPPPAAAPSAERYQPLIENAFAEVTQAPLSTFSIDVDTAAYANVRRFLNQGALPPADAVRLEEMINYFPYAYEQPEGDRPFSVQVDVAEAPWKPEHRLARIAIKGRDIQRERMQANFVFLVDVSGSMGEANKLPLVKQSLHLLAEQLHDGDRVALVTYAGSSGVALESTSDKEKLRAGIDALSSGGSTNGASGIQLAYEQAQKHFIKEGINRVLLCTDGDFNVGISSPQELEKLIKDKAQSGVFLSVLGYGTGNLQDYTMETLADKGNGNYAYIDSLGEARKVLVEQMHGTLVTIAKDVKIQVEFNPTQVASYRLIGYENRLLAKEDFNNDRKDAGEIGAGHTVTALYEIVPVGVANPDGRPVVDGLKYQKPAAPATAAAEPLSDETLTVKLRYKQPDGNTSQLIEVPVKDAGRRLAESSKEFQFATSVVGFGMLLRQSAHAGELNWENVRQLALSSKGEDPLGYRGEFLQLIDKARGLTARR